MKVRDARTGPEAARMKPRVQQADETALAPRPRDEDAQRNGTGIERRGQWTASPS